MSADPSKSLDYAGEIAANLKATRQVIYKKVDARELHLHFFEPKGHKPSDRRACFITIHGGGWRGGEPRRMYPFASRYAELGMVGISVEYRLVIPGSNMTVFDCVKDGRSAVRHVRMRAAELGVDPRKVIVSGASAGGHIAVGTALFDGIDETGEDATVSSQPNALVLYYPVVDTSQEGYGYSRIGARWHELSPLRQVRSSMPPTLMFHGTGDTVTPFSGAKAFHDAMLKAGNRCELVVTEGGNHGYLMFERPHYEETLRKTEEFLASLGLLRQYRGNGLICHS